MNHDSKSLRCGKRVLGLSRPQVMGILNVTPDSFSDGGHHFRWQDALDHADAMVQQGAAIIDIGGESTRPGAATVSSQQELDRVLPVLEAITARFDTVCSVDTSNPVLMCEAVRLGAGMLNDIRAFQRPDAEAAALDAAQRHGVALCIMHMQGEPANMQTAPHYQNVVQEVRAFLISRASRFEQLGVPATQLVLDPGFGFGKDLAHNYALLRELVQLTQQRFAVLAGLSRKSMIGAVVNRPIDQRLSGSLAAAVLAAERGVSILRVHDVAATVDALKVLDYVLRPAQ
ncbi:Dihydropteroate synthase (FolP) [gamma proteobacterium HdN1]|nr:Dihydropteroate synthase (FolP) [gamma proteobacterium HdN1]